MGTTMRMIGEASWRRRMSTRSMTRPRAGAKTHQREHQRQTGTGIPTRRAS
jgi:hypothetical protein